MDEIRAAVRAALMEDIGSGDVTTLAIIPESAFLEAAMVAREPLVLAGSAFAEAAFAELSGDVKIERSPRTAATWSAATSCWWFGARRGPY